MPFVIWPLAGWLALARSALPTRERWVISVFGIRGMGSFYYLAFAFNHGRFDDHPRLWAIVTLVVLLSVLLHGISANGVMARLDAWRARRGQRRQPARPSTLQRAKPGTDALRRARRAHIKPV